VYQNSDRIALFCHIRPDGDTIGSVLGFGWALQAAGKEVSIHFADDIPSQDRLRFEDYVDTSPFQKTPGLLIVPFYWISAIFNGQEIIFRKMKPASRIFVLIIILQHRNCADQLD
jgi:hypothetical protein